MKNKFIKFWNWLFNKKPIIINQRVKCYLEIIGQLNNSKNSNITVLIHHESKYNEFYDRLIKILESEGFEPELTIVPNSPSFMTSRRIIFSNNSNHIKIWTLKSVQIAHPQDLVLSEKDWDNILITDLENIPDEFYKEKITVGNCAEILDKYKQYIKI